MARKIALVTGASSGIGEMFARKLAARGYGLILTARREERLRKVAAELGGAEVMAADLATSEGLARVEAAIASANSLELLVNNAGFGTMGRFWQANAAGQQRMMDVHITATMRLTHAALRRMVEQRRGGVINVSSVAAFNHSAGSVSYCASKAWINSFTQGLSVELRGIGSPIKMQALCPGFTSTEFHETLGVEARLIPGWLWMSPDAVVEASLRGFERGKVIVIPGWQYKISVAALKLLPPSLTQALQKLRRDKRA